MNKPAFLLLSFFLLNNSVCMCVRACVRACVRVYVRVCVCVCTQVLNATHGGFSAYKIQVNV